MHVANGPRGDYAAAGAISTSMRVLVSYATERFRAHQWLNAHTARRVGGFDEIRRFGPETLDAAFVARNRETLAKPRGAGYWLWKPYLVVRELATLAPGDVLFYADAGARFRGSVAPLVALCARQDVVPFELPFVERAWTKRDAFVRLGCDTEAFASTPQRHATFMLFRKSLAAVDLATRWLEAAEDPQLLTDVPNACGMPNYPGFVDHRHDQSIWSLLTKRAGYAAFRDPRTHRVPSAGAPGEYGRILSHRRRRTRLRHRLAAALGLPP